VKVSDDVQDVLIEKVLPQRAKLATVNELESPAARRVLDLQFAQTGDWAKNDLEVSQEFARRPGTGVATMDIAQ
jgi:hypothetical protein